MEPKRLSLRPFERDPTLDLHTMTEEYLVYGHRLEQHIADTSKLMWEMLDAGEKVIFEGAQGAMLDIDHGTYPFVTSSNPLVGRGVRRERHRAEGDRRGLGDREGLHHAGRGGAVPERARRRHGRADQGARGRVRHDHRAPAPHRLARPRRAALRGAPELAHGARASPSSTCSPASSGSSVCTSYRGADGAEFEDFPYHQTVLHHTTAELTELPGVEGGPRRVPHALGPAPGGARLPRPHRRADRRAGRADRRRARAASRSSGPRPVAPRSSARARFVDAPAG